MKGYIVTKKIVYPEGDINLVNLKVFKSFERAKKFVEKEAEETYNISIKWGEDAKLIKTKENVAVEAETATFIFEVKEIDLDLEDG